ncbi:MAG: hypothetical protein HYV26_05635 [Candidatus Hydrogenedentes bacterium]|nr:hypothetical protein [Candidatus Hydrogenedentota bacterium]
MRNRDQQGPQRPPWPERPGDNTPSEAPVRHDRALGRLDAARPGAFLGYLRFLVLVSLASVLSMGIAFGLTRYLLWGGRMASSTRAVSLEEVTTLRAHANELFDLANQFQEHMKRSASPREAAPWIASVFQPRLIRFEERLKQDVTLPAAPRETLLVAVGQLVYAAKHPEEAGRPQQVWNEAQTAVAQVERFIMAAGVRGRLAEPRKRVVSSEF